MRYLKRLILAVLIYLALYLPFIAVLQALTGTDLTADFRILSSHDASIEIQSRDWNGILIEVQEAQARVFAEAYDPAGSGRTYTETDEIIETDIPDTEEKAKAYDIIMGVNE